MAVGDLYKGRIRYDFLGRLLENRFFYRQTAGTGAAQSFALALELDVIPDMRDIQSDSVTHVDIIVTNLDDPTDFFTELTGGAGNRTGDASPPFTSWGFTYFSTNTLLRSGGKRVGGTSELDIDNGVATVAALLLLDDLAATFLAAIEHPGTGSFFTPQLHTAGNGATGGLPLTVSLRGVSYRRVTTQSSRKFPV